MAAVDKNTGNKVKKAEEHRYTKEQLLSSEKFSRDRDLLEAVLADESYTAAEVEKKIEQYKKGRVK